MFSSVEEQIKEEEPNGGDDTTITAAEDRAVLSLTKNKHDPSRFRAGPLSFGASAVIGHSNSMMESNRSSSSMMVDDDDADDANPNDGEENDNNNNNNNNASSKNKASTPSSSAAVVLANHQHHDPSRFRAGPLNFGASGHSNSIMMSSSNNSVFDDDDDDYDSIVDEEQQRQVTESSHQQQSSGQSSSKPTTTTTTTSSTRSILRNSSTRMNGHHGSSSRRRISYSADTKAGMTSTNTIAHSDHDEDEPYNKHHHKPSNEYVLNVAFFSFFGFMCLQAIFAILANSQAMLADCEAMAVDALTYLFNLVAERIKHMPYSAEELAMPPWLRQRRRKLRRLYLELIPPLISVSTLLVVTILVIREALGSLFGIDDDDDNNNSADDEPNIWIMLIFSALNLLLDIVNVTCFARTGQAFGLVQPIHPTVPPHHLNPQQQSPSTVSESQNGATKQETNNNDEAPMDETRPLLMKLASRGGLGGEIEVAEEVLPTTSSNEQIEVSAAMEDSSENIRPSLLTMASRGGMGEEIEATFEPPATEQEEQNQPTTTNDTEAADKDLEEATGDDEEDDEEEEEEDEEDGRLNLNMCSAWTHVCADTLRSITVLLAAGVAAIWSQVTPEEADATGAIVVSIIILVSLLPLLDALRRTAMEIYDIWLGRSSSSSSSGGGNGHHDDDSADFNFDREKQLQ